MCVRGEGATGACNGDSGGPLACPLEDRSDSVLVGVASFVIVPCGSGINADGYVGVSHLAFVLALRIVGLPLVCLCVGKASNLNFI